MKTFVNLPEKISSTIGEILSRPENNGWVVRAEKLHEKYMEKRSTREEPFITGYMDVLGYLGLRVSATYAQITSALLQIQEVMPDFAPTSLLDLGSGPGTGVWAATEVWPSIIRARCIDQEQSFLLVGTEILEKAQPTVAVTWQLHDVPTSLENDTGRYDLIIIANVLNELSELEREQVVEDAMDHCTGVVLIIEPGTPLGFSIIQKTAEEFSKDATCIAPYINSSVVRSNDFWIHFPQRFQRPEFLRRVRQHMRESSLMASDFEETKFSYIALSKRLTSRNVWGRCVGPVTKQKGFLELPVLTAEGIEKIKILKRHKAQYSFAKEIKWGEIISDKKMLLV